MWNVLKRIFEYLSFFVFVRFLVFDSWSSLYSTVNWGISRFTFSWPSLRFLFHLLHWPVYPTGFSFYFFPGLLALFILLPSNNNNVLRVMEAPLIPHGTILLWCREGLRVPQLCWKEPASRMIRRSHCTILMWCREGFRGSQWCRKQPASRAGYTLSQAGFSIDCKFPQFREIYPEIYIYMYIYIVEGFSF